jgi:flagellar protein FliO/FliZ
VVELTVRLVLSLSLVVGLLLLLARFGGRRFRGKNDAMVRVLHRQHLSRSTAVSVVAVGNRVLVLGTSDQQVRVLAELDPEELADAEVLSLVPEELPALVRPAAPTPARAPAPVPGSHRAPGARRAERSEGALTGSVLSRDTWRQALAVATRRAS